MRTDISGGKPVPAALVQILQEFVATIGSGDATRLRQFIAQHFASDGDAPSVDERVQRMNPRA